MRQVKKKLRSQKYEIISPKKVPSIEIPAQNWEMQVLFSEFNRRYNKSDNKSGSRNKTTYSKF
jgi:hypothetical protein